MTAEHARPAPSFTVADLLRALAVAAWGLAFGWLLSSGRLAAYLSPDLWWLALGGMIIAVLLLFGLALTAGRGGFHVHSQPAAAWSRFAIVMFPLIYMLLSPPTSGLGSYDLKKRVLGDLLKVAGPQAAPAAVASSGDGSMPMVPQQSASGRPTQPAAAPLTPRVAADPAGEPQPATLLDIAYELEERGGGPQPVIVEGMFYPAAQLPPGHAILFRFVMVCCAADAQPVAAVLAGDGLDQLAEDQWLRATGVARLQQVDGRTRPVIVADKIEPIDAPRYPYLTPF